MSLKDINIYNIISFMARIFVNFLQPCFLAWSHIRTQSSRSADTPSVQISPRPIFASIFDRIFWFRLLLIFGHIFGLMLSPASYVSAFLNEPRICYFDGSFVIESHGESCFKLNNFNLISWIRHNKKTSQALPHKDKEVH